MRTIRKLRCEPFDGIVGRGIRRDSHHGVPLRRHPHHPAQERYGPHGEYSTHAATYGSVHNITIHFDKTAVQFPLFFLTHGLFFAPIR